ncbi:hypothetical protein F5Y19DRAFT_470265 [Xylariaceae sp. FL1651]|nr:hypothetical protein F5Y19DRAFT_470265 [Xylariaceae sp. FL1651]
MSPTNPYSVDGPMIRQLTQRFKLLSISNSVTGEQIVEPKARVVFTGESRIPLRERIQRMRGGQAIPTALRPGTTLPTLYTLASIKTPETSPTLAPIAECPGAPRKSKVHELRHLGQRKEDDDVLLDRQAYLGAKTPTGFVDRSLRSDVTTPSRRSPLLQSWGSDELAEIDAKLEALLPGSAHSNEKPKEPLCSALVKKLILESNTQESETKDM